MLQQKNVDKELISWLTLILPILVFIGPCIQFMALDVDITAMLEDTRPYKEYIIDWWHVSGLSRMLGQGAFVALFKIPGIPSLYQLAPVLAVFSKLLFVLTALRIMGRDIGDSVWLLALALVAPFWMDPALLFARSIMELMSVLVFYALFKKTGDQIGVGRILAFCILQVLVYEACLIPGLALLWFVRSNDRKPLYAATIVFGILYIVATKVGWMASAKLATSTLQHGVVLKSGDASTFFPYTGKLAQLINTVQAATPIIILISVFISSLLVYFLTQLLTSVNPRAGEGLKKTSFKWFEFVLACTSPVLVNWFVSQMVGNQGRVYWMMLSYSWLLLILLGYHWSLQISTKLVVVAFMAVVFFISAILVFELHVDLLNHDLVGFSGRFFRGFTSHFGFY